MANENFSDEEFDGTDSATEETSGKPRGKARSAFEMLRTEVDPFQQVVLYNKYVKNIEEKKAKLFALLGEEAVELHNRFNKR